MWAVIARGKFGMGMEVFIEETALMVVEGLFDRRSCPLPVALFCVDSLLFHGFGNGGRRDTMYPGENTHWFIAPGQMLSGILFAPGCRDFLLNIYKPGDSHTNSFQPECRKPYTRQHNYYSNSIFLPRETRHLIVPTGRSSC